MFAPAPEDRSRGIYGQNNLNYEQKNEIYCSVAVGLVSTSIWRTTEPRPAVRLIWSRTRRRVSCAFEPKGVMHPSHSFFIIASSFTVADYTHSLVSLYWPLSSFPPSFILIIFLPSFFHSQALLRTAVRKRSSTSVRPSVRAHWATKWEARGECPMKCAIFDSYNNNK